MWASCKDDERVGRQNGRRRRPAAKGGKARAEPYTHGNAEHADFERRSTLLAALPLASDQYGLCCRRLANAMDYYSMGEWGAAAYEVHLIGGSLAARAKRKIGYTCA